MTDYKRLFLYLALVFIGMQIWTAWQHDFPPVVTNTVEATNNQNNSANVPVIPSAATVAAQPQSTTILPQPTQIVTVKTDVIEVNIDPMGGNIVSAKLTQYPEHLHNPQPFTLLNTDPNTYYVAQSGLTGNQGPDTTQSQVTYTVDHAAYELSSGNDTITVPLTWRNDSGLLIKKIFTFKRNNYVINVSYQINNQMSHSWSGHLYTQLTRKNIPPAHTGLFNMPTYLGAAISSPDNMYEKISFSTMEKQPLSRIVTGGWLAMLQHYFLGAWIPQEQQLSQFYSKASSDQLYTIGALGPEIRVPATQHLAVEAKLYIGPEELDRLQTVAPGLNLTVDYGKLWFISIAILWLMKKIYLVVGNWGWSIVLVTVVIKLLFYKLSASSYRSMASLRNLQPRIATLKERHGDDKQKFSQAMMELYKKEKVNPLGGCLPILVQIPVFLGLYWVLIESVELRQAPWTLWIHDLSAKDPFYVLPILMGFTMVIQQKLSPAPPDPTQAKVMMMLPVVFTVLFMTFPAGLVLYWLVNNTLSILQQWYVTKTIVTREK